MNQEYLEYKCIKSLSDENKKRFQEVVNVYGKKLDETVIHDGGTVYTLHDFTHHCCNIYHIIGDIILYQDAAFSSAGLTEREKYLLDLSVLLHDIGMLGNVGPARDTHSRDSAEKIEEEYNKEESPLYQGKSGIGRNEINAIKKIVQAHSDVRGRSADTENNGLDDTRLNNNMPGKQGERIRARFLANLLRMADEMDITNERLGELKVMQELRRAQSGLDQLKKELEGQSDSSVRDELLKEIKRKEASAKSLKLWGNLRLFNEITCDGSGKVWIKIDDDYIDDCIRNGESINEIADDVNSVYSKIMKEFSRFRDDISKDVKINNMVAMKGVALRTDNDALKGELEALKKKEKIERPPANDVYPQLLSEEVASAISTYVDNKKLYKAGHYILQKGLCARDWVMAGEMIEDEQMSAKFVEQFMLHLKSLLHGNERCLIIGIDFYGMLIAAKLALAMGLPYTYIVPEDRRKSYTEGELLFNPEDYDQVVVVIDVIVTYKTVKDIIKKCSIENRLSAIYTVFFRDTEKHKYLHANTKWVEQTYALNGEYEIEIHQNTNCRYRDCNNCRAANRRYD